MRDQYVKLIILLQNQEKYINGNELAKKLGVSSRSVRSYIKDLNDNYLVDARIVTHQSKGYLLKGEINELKRNDHLAFEERAFFIVKYFLESNDWITYDNIAQKLFFSSQTIRTDILKIQEMIEEQKRAIHLESIIFQGLTLKGTEIDKRLFLDGLANPPMLTHDNLKNTLLYYFKDWIQEDELTSLLKLLEKHLETSNLLLTPEGLLPVISYLIISLKRMSQGNYIIQHEYSVAINASFEYQLAEKILHESAQLFDLDVTEAEVYFFSFYLMSQRVLGGFDESELNKSVPENLKTAVKDVISELEEQYSYSFSEDTQLYSGLILHLVRDLYPLIYNFYIENTYISHIKMEFIQAYHMAVSFAHLLQSKADLHLPENEIGYIALHFASFLERNAKKHIKVAIVQERSQATANLLKTNIERRFSDIEIIGIFHPYEFDKIPKDVQMVISQTELTVNTTIPIVYVSSFLTNEDYQKINEMSHQNMLSNLINQEHFFKTNETDKEKLLMKMAQKLGATSFYPSILDREKLSTTDIGDQVALPHPLEYEENPTFQLGIAINQQPIDWGNQEVRLVLLLLPSSQEQERYAYIFKELHEILKDKTKIKKLLTAETADDFLRCIDE